MPRAIELTDENIPVIFQAVDRVTDKSWKEDLAQARLLDEKRWIVLQAIINGVYYPWLNCRDDYFQEKFELIEPLREHRFTRVHLKKEAP